MDSISSAARSGSAAFSAAQARNFSRMSARIDFQSPEPAAPMGTRTDSSNSRPPMVRICTRAPMAFSTVEKSMAPARACAAVIDFASRAADATSRAVRRPRGPEPRERAA
jgi:hypothetical protein